MVLVQLHVADCLETNHPTVPDMTPIPFTGEREEFDVAATEEEINNMKDSNGTI